MKLPVYPVYVPSKGRADYCLTARFLIRDRVPFFLVVEPQEREAYEAKFGGAAGCTILELPENDRGLYQTRNWIKAHSVERGDVRHWQIDDNIESIWRLAKGARLRCRAGPALHVTEHFVDRYENVAVAGLNYVMFGAAPGMPPFYLNVHVYSCTLVLNEVPYGWRLAYNDDTDLCLQVLAGGWCTVLMNAFLVQKIRTMVVPGGNTDDPTGPVNYQADGRLRMARALERKWPGVVKTKRRFQRPQHVIAYSWGKFDTPLKRKKGVRVKAGTDNFGMELRAVKPVRSDYVRRLLEG